MHQQKNICIYLKEAIAAAHQSNNLESIVQQ